MNARRVGRLGLAAAAVVFVVGAGLLASAQVLGASHAISIESATTTPDGQVTVRVEARNMTAPGLGAWKINVGYDPAVLAVLGCNPENGSVCNASFASDTVRVTGANGFGLEGDTSLASINFECRGAEATSALTLSLDLLADATVGDPQPISAAAENGTITCEEAAPTATEEPVATAEEPTATMEPQATATSMVPAAGLPDAGTGASGSLGGGTLNWLIAVLAAAGLAAGAGALRLRAVALPPEAAATGNFDALRLRAEALRRRARGLI